MKRAWRVASEDGVAVNPKPAIQDPKSSGKLTQEECSTPQNVQNEANLESTRSPLPLDVKSQIVCLSALLTVTMPSMKTTIEAMKQAGVREQVKVLVGGAPVTQQYADDIGADGYGESASNAVAMARRMCGVG